MRLVFMGTSPFALPSLLRLLEEGYEIAAVYTKRDKPVGRGARLTPSPVKQEAQARGLPLREPPSLKKEGETAFLASLRPEVIVVAAYGLILPSQVLSIPPRGCLNLHPSLLPHHRGPSPVVGAILAGDATTGVSLMLMDEGVDSGPVIAQRSLPILPQDTAETLTSRLAGVGADLLAEYLPLWLAGKVKACPQEGEASYTKLLTKEDGEVDWGLRAEEIWRRLRAHTPWPGAFTRWRGRLVKLLEATPLPGGKRGRVGEVVRLEIPEAPLGVQAGEGVLALHRLQLEGKKPLSAEEFLRGQRDFLGSVLPS